MPKIVANISFPILNSQKIYQIMLCRVLGFFEIRTLLLVESDIFEKLLYSDLVWRISLKAYKL
jgi:hypothetical protein